MNGDPVTPAELLYATARVIEARGHAQKVYEDGDGCVCIFGAMHVAQGKPADDDFGVTPVELVAEKALRTVLGLTEVDDEAAVILWNDEPGRSKPEVLEALWAAAEVAA